MTTLTNLPQWQALVNHHMEISKIHLRDLFISEPNRFEKFSLELDDDLFLDYSKNIITETTLALLLDLANKKNLPEQIEQLFTGKKINNTEDRSALHWALRHPNNLSLTVDNQNISQNITNSLQKMIGFTEQFSQNSTITDVVNIGIGGSYLGPIMALEALKPYFMNSHLKFHFLANIDPTPLVQLQKKLNPKTTLFIISSKSFSTQETLTNALTLQHWLRQQGLEKLIQKNFLAVTANPDKALAFGIPEENIFQLWDWVGGRYSLWSAIGLPLMLAIGKTNFQEFLKGAHLIDNHFRHAPLLNNMPVILGLLSIWYQNFFQASGQAILPYAESLQYLPAYLQQLTMESNGKNISRNGEQITYRTSPILFGETGTNGQHSFYQLLHQGTHFIPVDFIIPLNNHNSITEHHEILIANALSQSKAFMDGTEKNQVSQHKILTGNRPSNSILLNNLSPRALGSLLALYEHKTFVESVIWDINPFDQWGVERGKELTNNLLPYIKNINYFDQLEQDSSTSGLIKRYHQAQKRPR